MSGWTPDISNSDGPTYLAVANAYGDAIERGDLPAGSRLPPQRDLARELGVTVGTISRAYAVMKKRELISGEVGRGTFVRSSALDPQPLDMVVQRTVGRAVDLACFRAPASGINSIIAEAMGQATDRGGRHPMHKYPPASGLLSHRADGAQWLARYGLQVGSDQVIVCGGAQMALNVVLGTLERRSGKVLTEATTYAGLRAICTMQELELVGLEIDEFGVLPQALDRACAAEVGRVLVVQPTLHNPTTASMPLERRRDIARLAIKHDLIVIEDDTAGGMLRDRPVPIAQLAPDHTVYITSISKCLSPALRLGYIAAPRQMVERFDRAMHTLALGVPPLICDIMTALLSSGAADRIVAMNYEETKLRHAIASDILKTARVRSRPGAFFAWLAVPAQWRSYEFVAAAMRAGVTVTDGDDFQVDRKRSADAVRIAIDGAPGHEVLRRGLNTLRTLLEDRPEPWTATI